ncbi:MAG: hypothetical protein WBL61_06560 [Bryobacteraceae bacterium]
MADFRKWILALSVLALVFTGVASAQGGVINEGTNLICQAGTAVPPQLRTEGYTELVGDITLICTGGSPIAIGQPIPQANIVVNLQGTITSRLLGNGSEALLMLDEPGTAPGLQGVGPAETQYLCPTPLTGCLAWVGTVTNTGAPGGAIAPVLGPTGAANFQPAPNVFQGVTNGANQVTFFGVPILPPVSNGSSRVVRITNLRVNANGITGGGSGFQNVLAQISVNNVQVSVTNPTVTVGYIQQSFQGSFRNAANNGAVTTVPFYQCNPQTNQLVAVLRFSELFGTAFKTRVNGGGVYPGTTSATAIQNTPGAIYNSESGFISAFSGGGGPLTGTGGGNTYTAGLADYGTRLKAVFNNIPSGVTIYVSSVNVVGGVGTGGGAPAPVGTSFANSFTTLPPEYAYMVNGETSVDPQAMVTPTTGTEYAVTNGSPLVWEVVQALPNTNENFDFGVYVTFANTVQPNAASGITATLSYAPTPTAPFSASAAGQASSSLTIPRFAIAANSSQTPFLTFSLCSTTLLFPYVTTAFGNATETAGFDTGISIANTTSDPFSTPNQHGLCTLYWYGGPPGATTPSTPPAYTILSAGGVVLTPSASAVDIMTGTTALTLASQSVGPGWTGYMIAVCNFQYAHGYANVTDVGVRNIMASYLALVINDRAGANTFPGAVEALEN